MTTIGYEVNFDGLIGPTHNFSGLSVGNLASMKNQNQVSNPKAAALQGLEKMKLLTDLGVRQGILIPHERPHLPSLRALGFSGTDRTLPEKAFKELPDVLRFLSSASPSWTANSATLTPSVDSVDNHVHITPANMYTKPHRAFEGEFTSKVLKLVFPSSVYFVHHPPLPLGEYFSDEGAANHCRFCSSYLNIGVHLFVYGKSSLRELATLPSNYPARQTLEASQAIHRSHLLYPDHSVFLQQNPEVIDKGVFHNDVIATNQQNLFIYHEEAFVNAEEGLSTLDRKVKEICDTPLILIKIPSEKISVEKAVRTYLFNSQIILNTDNTMSIIAPIECQRDAVVYQYLDLLTKQSENPIRDIHYINLTESMRNGGGPACLRLRAILNQNEYNAVNSKMIFNEKLYEKLKAWIEKHYRDRLAPEDLADPTLVDETQTALDELTNILELGSIYSFQ